jgi:tetratricopeptide (TPR) repeat protein
VGDDRDVQKVLYRVRLQLEEGRYEAALAVLQEVHSDEEQQQREVAYLLSWCYIQSKRWADAIHMLSPLLKREELVKERETLAERERSVLSLLHLGIAAVNLSHYEDASHHFTLCLKVLHDRRVHLPSVRIKARYSLAMTCLMRGLYAAAIHHYEEALRLCQYYHQEEVLPDIYYGLCSVYRCVGDYISAYTAGQEALRLYQQKADRSLEARVHTILGRISFLLNDYREAADHYTESLAIGTSCQSPTMVMLNCAALAELRLAEARLDEAKRYCQFALEVMERTESAHMRGRTYHIIGKVSHAEAREAEGELQQQLLEQAMRWYEKAKEQLAQTQAYADIAEVYGAWAQVLEDLGRAQEAIKYWRSGYKVLSRKTSLAEHDIEGIIPA